MNHQRNPRKIKFFMAKEADDNDSPGLGPDFVLRDLFRNPFIIGMDMNGDGSVDLGPPYDRVNHPVAVWSFGSNRRDGGLNDKENLLSWK